MTLADILDLTLLASLIGFALLDRLAPARRFPTIRYWRIKGVVSLVLFYAILVTAPALWDRVLGAHRLVDLGWMGTAGGAVVAFLVLELFNYVWHRLLHAVPWLWRVHQTHHAPERLDIWGAFYFHPLGAVGWALAGSLALVWAVGVTVEAAVIANAAVTFLSTLGHANLKTPRWLGYFIARPEMHALHHQRGVHRYNYCDIALWDMVFGTWRNPATFDEEVGLRDGATDRVGDLLLGRDVLADDDEPRDSEPAVEASMG